MTGRSLSARSLLQKMRDEGYRRIRYRGQDGTDFVVRACFKKKRLRLRFSAYGEVLRRRDMGPCVTPTLDELKKRFRDRGTDRMTIFVEGCRRGIKYRVRVDEFGIPIDRARIGKCK